MPEPLDAHLQQHGSMLSNETVDLVRELRDKAEEAHSAGDHAGAMEAIQQAHNAMGTRADKVGRALSIR